VTDTFHLACAVEDPYVEHSAAMLRSVLDQRPPAAELLVHYMHPPELGSAARDSLAGMVEGGGARILFHEIGDELVSGFPIEGFTRKATWYRVFLPDLVPEVDRALYLDADLIALQDLTPLWRTKLGDNLIAAVSNVHQWDHLDRPASIGLPEDLQYFNAGVLLLDLAGMRRERTTDDLRRFVIENAETLDWRDQDALNLVLGRRRLRLHPRWNVMNSIVLYPWAADLFGEVAVEEARSDPAIRHFEGPSLNKPWHYLCDHEMRELYTELRSRTPWPVVEIEGRTPANIVRRALWRLRGRPAVTVPDLTDGD
jgi:lipopolysaccharide biosynthesis glycosyltransferase